MTRPYHPPVKRSLAIKGHKTSISLEPVFWALLKAAAAAEGVPMAQLVARIDAERIRVDLAPGLAGAVRCWLAADLLQRMKGGEASPAAPAEATQGFESDQ